LIHQDNTKGALEVRAKNGDWIKADPVPDAFVVNIGDMLNASSHLVKIKSKVKPNTN